MSYKKSIILFFFILLLLLGVQLSPDAGGNGNPALIIIVFLIPLMIYYLYLFYQLIKRVSSIKYLLFINLASVSILIWGWIHQVNKLSSIRMKIRLYLQQRGIPIDEQYIADVTTGLTQYTNTVYISYVTFFMSMSVVAFITCIIIFLKKVFRSIHSPM